MPTGRASIFSDRSVLIVDTKAVPLATDRQVIAYYEIHAAPDASWPYPTVYVTRNQQDYETALAAEGTTHRFDLTWRHGDANGKRCLVLEQLAPAAPIQEIAS